MVPEIKENDFSSTFFSSSSCVETTDYCFFLKKRSAAFFDNTNTMAWEWVSEWMERKTDSRQFKKRNMYMNKTMLSNVFLGVQLTSVQCQLLLFSQWNKVNIVVCEKIVYLMKYYFCTPSHSPYGKPCIIVNRYVSKLIFMMKIV